MADAAKVRNVGGEDAGIRSPPPPYNAISSFFCLTLRFLPSAGCPAPAVCGPQRQRPAQPARRHQQRPRPAKPAPAASAPPAARRSHSLPAASFRRQMSAASKSLSGASGLRPAAFLRCQAAVARSVFPSLLTLSAAKRRLLNALPAARSHPPLQSFRTALPRKSKIFPE